MSDHQYYRWTGKPHKRGRNREIIARGTVFEPTASEVEAFSDKMTPVEAEEVTVSESVGASDETGTRTSAPDPADLTVSEIRDAIADIEDPDALGEMYDRELGGQARETALDAIDSRISAVSGE